LDVFRSHGVRLDRNWHLDFGAHFGQLLFDLSTFKPLQEACTNRLKGFETAKKQHGQSFATVSRFWLNQSRFSVFVSHLGSLPGHA
jgi:hypothetical protein